MRHFIPGWFASIRKQQDQHPIKYYWILLTLVWGFFVTPTVANVLQEVNFSAFPGNKVELILKMAESVNPPSTFTTQSPARIAMDFPGISSALTQKTQLIGVGGVESVTVLEVSDRTRVVVNLATPVPHQIRVRGNEVLVSLGSQPGNTQLSQQTATAPSPAPVSTPPKPRVRAVDTIDFRRGAGGEGQIWIQLSDPSVPINVTEEGEQIIVELQETQLPRQLRQRLDVTDFATPVTTIDSRSVGSHVRIAISAVGDYDYLAYQSNTLFRLDFRPLTQAERETQQRRRAVYTGDRLSLNFQDIEIRAVLQLLADFTNFNLVVNDTVGGRITLRLENVPWDQALDIILKTKGLSKRESGNVMYIAPTAEIVAQETQELQAQKKVEELAPLQTEFFHLNYATAGEIESMLRGFTMGRTRTTSYSVSTRQSDGSNQPSATTRTYTSGDPSAARLLSDRGNVVADTRTNTLIIQDTADRLAQIRELILQLDVPLRQVIIDSRVVVASENFAKELGVRFGFTKSNLDGDTNYVIGGTQPDGTGLGEDPTGAGGSYDSAGLLVNLPAAAASGSIGLMVGKVGSYLLQLELSALQQEGRGEVISSPRVLTLDNNTANIEQGVSIPYQTEGDDGPVTAFTNASLSLNVTPKITPDDRIELDITVNKDVPNEALDTSGAGPAIDTRSVRTKVLVDNGETVVLGGVYETSLSTVREQVPFFGDLPLVGSLFRSKRFTDTKAELLIFVTPRVLKESLDVR